MTITGATCYTHTLWILWQYKKMQLCFICLYHNMLYHKGFTVGGITSNAPFSHPVFSWRLMSYWGLINTLQISSLMSVRDSVKLTTLIFTVHFIIAPELAGNGFLMFLLFLLPSRLRAEKKLPLLKLCQVQIIIYSLTLNIALTSEERKEVQRPESLAEPRAPSALFPQTQGQTQKFDIGKYYLLQQPLWSTWDTVLMSENTKLNICVLRKQGKI